MANATDLTSSTVSQAGLKYDEPERGELLVYIVAEVVIAVIALLSNLFVLIAIVKFKNLQTSTYWLLASLSVADISVAIVGIPSAIVLRIGLVIFDDSNSSNSIDKAAVDRTACLIIVSVVIFLTQVSIWSLLLIAVDRFVAIHYHLRYRAIVTSFRVKVGIVGAWLGGALIGVVPQIGWTAEQNKDIEDSSASVERCAFEEVTSMDYMVYFNFFGCVLLPLAAMFVLYFMIFRSAKQQLRKIYADVAFHRRRKLSKVSITSIRELLHANLGISSPPKQSCRTERLKKMHIKSKSLDIDAGRDELQNFAQTTEIRTLPREITASAMDNGHNFNNNAKVTNLTNSVPRNTSRSSIRRSLSSPMIFNPQIAINETETAPPVPNKEDVPKYKRTKLKLPVFRRKESKKSPCNISPTIDDYSTPVSESPFVYEIGRLDSDASSCGTMDRHTLDKESEITRRKLRRRSKLIRKEFRAARSLFTVIGVFALCWLPLHILNCITLFCPGCGRSNWLIDMAILLSHANSFLNPIIYAFRLREMKVAFQKLLGSLSKTMKTALCCNRNTMMYSVAKT